MIIDEIRIFKILFMNSFSKFMNFFLTKIYKNITTPTQDDTDVAIGIIKNPTRLNKLKLINIFKKTINAEI